MSHKSRRMPTLLDAILLVGSAAIGLGMFQWAHRSMFQGWIWMLDDGLPARGDWMAINLVVTCTDTMVLFIPLAAPWTFLLLLLRGRPPRPCWRRIWRQPGMAACLAALLGWIWSLLAVLVAFDATQVARTNRTITLFHWVQKYLSDGVFMYVGLAVAATWISLWISGRWRRSADWIDFMGRVVGVLWIAIGFAWTVRAYLDLL
jgi:hypothetical protein